MVDFEALERRVAERAHRIWEEAGRPEGQADIHWSMAKEQIGIEDNQLLASRPNPAAEGREYADGSDTAEPLAAVENQVADLPGRTDQAEQPAYPAPRRRKTA